MITRSGKKLRVEVEIGGFAKRTATEIFFVSEDSWEECVHHPDLPKLGEVSEGWICITHTFDEQADGLCKVTTKYVEEVK